jgi:hypothetical protein
MVRKLLIIKLRRTLIQSFFPVVIHLEIFRLCRFRKILKIDPKGFSSIRSFPWEGCFPW